MSAKWVKVLIYSSKYGSIQEHKHYKNSGKYDTLRREVYIDLIYMGSRKRQDLLSKLGAWGPWERVEGEGNVRKGEEWRKRYS